MKKSVLLLSTVFASASAFAQWTVPVPSQTQEMATDGTAQFLYNLEAGAFFGGGNDWNTRASVIVNPDPVKFIVSDGEWYNFACYPSAKNAWLYVSCNNFDAMWVDAGNDVGNESYPGTDSWQIKQNGDGTYSISNSECKGTLGVAEIYRGQTGNTRVYINDPEDMYDVDGEGMPSISGKFYDKWVFVDSTEVEALKPQIEVYMASVSLKAGIEAVKAKDAAYNTKNIDAVYANTSATVEELNDAKAICDAIVEFADAIAKAKEAYPSLDFSEPVAVYNDINSTAEELQAAKSKIQEIINEYLSAQASFENPYDYTSIIGNGSAVDPWKREFTGNGEIGTWHTNTWSTEANGGADGTDMTTPFCEDWVANGSILSDQKIYQVLAGAAPGLYKFTANIRLYNEAGNVDSLTGAYMYFGDNRVTLHEQVDMYKSGSKCVLWSPSKFNIIAIVKEGGDIEFGIDIKDATFNWVAFKETSLLYYGNENCEENAAKLAKLVYNINMYEDENANKTYIDAYNAAVEAFDLAVDPEDIQAAALVAQTAMDALKKNIDAYKKFNEKVYEWEKNLTDNPDLAGEDWDNYSDFVQGSEAEGYPELMIEDVIEGYLLTTEELEEYIGLVDSLFAHAIATSLTEGSICTGMLVNPNFADANGKGWTKGGNVTNYAPTGGFIPTADHPELGFPVAESWHSTFDIYQYVEGLPDGIYSLSLNGFCRLDDGVDTEVPAEIYMNDFATPLMNILEDKQPKGTAEDGKNCYLSAGAEGAAMTTNPLFIGAGTKSPADNVDSSDDDGYWPNGMQGASVAFSADRYKATVYGLVEGGKMRIGVRNLKSTHVWALWGNFQLIYQAKNPDAVEAVSEIYIKQASDYLENHYDEMTEPAATTLQNAIEACEDAAGDGNEQFDALAKLNAALVDAKENVELSIKANEEFDNMQAVYDENADAAVELKAQFDGVCDIFDNLNTLTTKEVSDLITSMQDMVAAIKAAALNSASDDNPADASNYIVNADFEQNTKGQQATGWTLVKGEGAQGNYQVQTGFDGGVSMEFWSNTNGSGTKYDFYQDLTKLPAGTYELTADAANSLNGQAAGPGTGFMTIYVAVGDSTGLEYTDVPVAVQEAGCADAYENYSIIFKVEEGQNVRIGSRNVDVLSARWCMIDNFRLTYYGKDSQKEITTEIAATAPVAISISEIYSVAGARLNTLQKGINIVKMSNGDVKKIMVK